MENLTDEEKRIMRRFFDDNMEWILRNSLLTEEGLKQFLEMYGDYLVDNNYVYSRNLMNFIMVIKDEMINARCNYQYGSKYSTASTLKRQIDNPKIRAWYQITKPSIVKKITSSLPDYEEYNRILESKLRRREMIKRRNDKQDIM